jgi:hypothetical protein
MASTITARVQLRDCATFQGHGHKFKRGQVKVLSNADDIAYFQRQSVFRVTILETAPAAPSTSAPASQPPPPSAKPAVKTTDDGGGNEGSGETSQGSGVLPWKASMKKADLLAAAHSRGMAVTEDDRNADIIQMLREYDEDLEG